MLRTASGSTGNALQDGLTRGAWLLAVNAFVAFTVMRWEWLTTNELAMLSGPIQFVALVLAGAFDHYIKPRLT